MKKKLLILLLVIFSIQFAKAEEKLKLSGKVENIKITEKKDILQIDANVRMSLKVIGTEPLLFWKQTYPHDESLRGHFLGLNLRVFGFLATEDKEKLLYLNGLPLPSIQRTKQWQDIVAEMDGKSPPENQVQSIKSGETVDFDEAWTFIFLKRKAIGSNDPYWGYGSDSNVLADEILKAKDLKIRVKYRVWSPELEPRSAASIDKKPFGKKLQKRWKKYGYLWLDDITSEPISLDLSSAVVKTDSKP